MVIPDIPVDKAELLSTLLETVLYGFSLMMFGGTIWTLVSRRSTVRVNRKMFAVACALLLCSTAHLVIDIIRVMEGLILYRDTFPGGPIAFFSDVAQWTFVSKNYVFATQTLIGDGVVLYRCYVTWQSKLVIILPALLWFAVGVTGFACPYTESRAGRFESKLFGWDLSQWITSYFTMTFTTNLLTTLLLAYGIRNIDKKATGLQTSRLRPMMHIIIDAGIIYSVTLLAQLICFSSKSNAQYVILDMIVPIISITFYMVIIRVGVANWASQSTNTYSSRFACTSNRPVSGTYRNSKMQVHVATCAEFNIENHRRSQMNSITIDRNGRDSAKLNSTRDVV